MHARSLRYWMRLLAGNGKLSSEEHMRRNRRVMNVGGIGVCPSVG